MLLRPRVRPHAVLRPVVRSSNNTLRFSQRRSEHTIPHLGSNDAKGRFFEEHGVPGFLTPKTYKQAWLEYQRHLCDEVNSSIEGQSLYANQRPLELHQTLSHKPENASLYNYAAMLHFNHFFWESLSSEKKPIPTTLENHIINEFGSVEDLRVEMLQHADAMFGNGFVWLVKEQNDRIRTKTSPLRIVCTYNAGSPYPNAHQRRQTQDMATADTSAYAARLSQSGPKLREVQNKVGSFGGASGAKSNSTWPNALESQPILCLNTWQHMYMLDYGILGKQVYLSAWWERIDWDIVYERYNMEPAHRVGANSPLNRFR